MIYFFAPVNEKQNKTREGVETTKVEYRMFAVVVVFVCMCAA